MKLTKIIKLYPNNPKKQSYILTISKYQNLSTSSEIPHLRSVFTYIKKGLLPPEEQNPRLAEIP